MVNMVIVCHYLLIFDKIITFNVSQFYFAVELMSSLMNLGLATAFPAGYFVEKFGPRWTCSLSILLGKYIYLLGLLFLCTI